MYILCFLDYNRRKRHKSGPDASMHLLKRVQKQEQEDEGSKIIIFYFIIFCS